MSQSIGLISPKSCSLSDFEAVLKRRWYVDQLIRENGSIELQIRLSNLDNEVTYISIAEISSSIAVEEFEENEDLPIDFRKVVSNRRFYIVYFNNFELVKDVLCELLSNYSDNLCEYWIDHDYGQVIPSEVFLKNILSDKNWDWRIKSS